MFYFFVLRYIIVINMDLFYLINIEQNIIKVIYKTQLIDII